MSIKKKELTLASICMCSTHDKEANVKKAISLIKEAQKAGADWVLLPEIFPFYGPYNNLHEMAEKEDGVLLTKLRNLAKELSICLFTGTVGERAEEVVQGPNGYKKVYNTLYTIDREGNIVARYRKMHLFNLYDQEGKSLYCESDGFIPGNETVSFNLEGFQVGLAICYDLRFPEFFIHLAKIQPLDIIVLPAAFTYETGKAHWELLLRARAVEQQSYMLAANQFGEHREGKRSYGHSMVIDPWGEILADTDAKEGIALAKISKKRIKEVRSKVPVFENRRLEIFSD